MINREWPLSGQRQCRTNSTELEETDKENKVLSVMDIILTVMCRGHLEKSMQTSNKHFLKM